jgi:hypothetical protein
MGRRLYSPDYRSGRHREREAQRWQKPAGTGWTGKVLLILAVLAAVIVIASFL